MAKLIEKKIHVIISRILKIFWREKSTYDQKNKSVNVAFSECFNELKVFLS